MIKYAKIINQETGLCEVGLGTNTEFYKSVGMVELDVKQSDMDNNWYLADKCPMKTDEQKEQEERDRVNGLKCTKRIFALMLQEVGIDYLTMLKPLIESNPQAQLEWELCVELERGNPLLDIMAVQLMITPEHLDLIFKYANGEITDEEFRAAIAQTEEDDDNTTDTTDEPIDIPVQPQDEDGLQEGAITD